jgi:tetratricopeptide (TPR) repeat protein/CHAT domain-containing protein
MIVALLVIRLSICASSGAAGLPQNADTGTDERALQALAIEFYEVCAKQDLERLEKLLSERSPLRLDRARGLGGVFADNSGAANANVTGVKIQGDSGTVTLAVVIVEQVPNTGMGRLSRVVRNLEFVREGGAWRLWDYVAAAERLAAQLMQTPPQDRARLLVEAKDKLTVDLQKELLRRATGMYFRQTYSEALDTYGLARAVAESIGSKVGMGRSLMGIANVYKAESEPTKAHENYKAALEVFRAAGDRDDAAGTWTNIAETYESERKYGQARDAFEKAVAEYEAVNNKAGVIQTLEAAGRLAYDQGDYQSAVALFKRCLEVREAAGSKNETGALLVGIANAYFAQKQYDQALATYRDALTRLDPARGRSEIIVALTYVAKICYLKHDYAAALESYLEALKELEAAGDKSETAKLLEDIANLYLDQHDYPNALQFFRRSLELREGMQDRAGAAGVLGGIGRAELAWQHYEAAIDSYRKSLALFETLKDSKGTLATLQNLAGVYYEQADYASALDNYRGSLTLATQLADNTAIANSHLGVGLTQAALGNFADALDSYNKALKLDEEMSDRSSVATLLHNIGLVYFSQGDYPLALEYYARSLKLDEELGNKAKVATTLGNIGTAHASAWNFSEAVDRFQKALELYQDLADREGTARMLGSIGSVYYLAGDYKQADQFLARSLALWETLGKKYGIAATLVLIGNVRLGQTDYVGALENYQGSLAIHQDARDDEAVGYLLAAIANALLEQGKYDLAVESAEKCGELAARLGNPELIWYVRYKAGDARKRLGRLAEAEADFTKAIAEVEQLRAQGFIAGSQPLLESKASPYRAMVELLVANGRVEQAFEYSERAKAQVLFEVIESGRVRVTRQLTEQEKEQEAKYIIAAVSLARQVSRQGLTRRDEVGAAALARKLQDARSQYQSFETALYAAHPDLRVFRGNLSQFNAQDASRLLDAHSAFLEYVVTDSNTYLFVLTAGESARGNTAGADGASVRHAGLEAKVYPLGLDRQALEGTVARFRDSAMSPTGQYTSLARELYSHLIAPAREQLAGKSSLVIVPDGGLWGLPFQALQPEEGRFFIEDAAISYAPSLAAAYQLGRQQAAKVVPQGLLALANPVLSGVALSRVRSTHHTVGLDPMPWTEREAAALAELYGAGRSKVHSLSSARSSRITSAAGEYGTVHLAAHAIIDDSNPMHSTLLLAAQDQKADGSIESREIINLDLAARALVMPYCERVTGRLRGGEGMLGTMWALLVAGSPAVIMSQWPTPSQSGELILELHKNLKSIANGTEPRLTESEALRRASLKMLATKEHSHPSFWAGLFSAATVRSK